jgi:hypothetical protein
MKIFTSVKMLALALGMMTFGGSYALAGNGTKADPYTVSELNAQKDALATSGDTVWVKADLKGLGVDGSKTSNATVDNVKQMAGLFGDATGEFAAYSWQILGELELADLTNTKDLLISLTYGTSGHPYGNLQSPQYASNYEPTDAHFSLVEVHNALQVTIENGLRGFHFPACVVIPKNVIAVKVSAGYKAGETAYVNYTNYIGADAEYVLPKNAAVVLMAVGGTYDFVLGTALYDQSISNGNAMSPGTQAGENAGTTKNRARFRFVCDGYRTGFERNSDENCTVILNSKDEVFLQVNTLETNFWGNYAWENPEKNWISWAGGQYSDYHTQATKATFDFTTAALRGYLGETLTDAKGYIYNETYLVENVSLNITGGSAQSRISASTHGNCLTMFKEYSTLTFRAPEGYAVTKVEFSIVFGNLDFSASTGTFDGLVWTGNAEGVRFLNNATAYLANAVVTLAAKDGATTALPAVEYKECANIAAFNALSAGDYAKVTLTDAEVTGVSADGSSTVFIQDATGGCWIQYTSLNAKLAEKTKVNGFVYVVARHNAGNVLMKEVEATLASVISATEIENYTITEGTLAEVNVAANKNKVVKITGATLEETSATDGILKQGDETIDVKNGTETANQQLHKIADWAKDTKLENVTVVAILVGKSATANQLLPISVTSDAAGIHTVNSIDVDNVNIYNLQGVRLTQLERGINIVSRKKVFVK